MRKVYSPPPQKSGWLGPIIGAVLLTLGVFLVLPLTQMVSSGIQKRLVLSKVDTATLAPPVEETEPPPPPPPPEEEPPPPPPSLSDTPPPMNLSVDLDLAMGSGGALAGFGTFSGADESTSILEFDVADLEKKPEVVSAVSPRYPPELRKAGIEGRVTIVFVLDDTGRVEDPRVETSTRPEFEQPALEAVRKWKFRPGMKDGEAVRTFMRLPIAFRVNS